MSDVHTVDRLEAVPEPTPDADFVVVDVIISSTSVLRLLEGGATYVKPFADPETALSFRAETDDAVLVGEQGGDPVDGFDLSPLPSVIASADVTDRPVGILTSNGTRAVHHIGPEEDVFIGSTVNAGAVASVLADRDRDVWLVAAGRMGDPAPEDTAGVDLIERSYRHGATAGVHEALATEIRESGTADWLADLGFEHELEALLDFHSSETVPQLRDGVFVDGSG
jgi:2-phosphosulfolactate phosphatase